MFRYLWFALVITIKSILFNVDIRILVSLCHDDFVLESRLRYQQSGMLILTLDFKVMSTHLAWAKASEVTG